LLIRNLQELSDSVEDVVLDANTTLHEALEASGAKLAQFQTAIQRGLAKQRYLHNLSDQYSGSPADEESRCCVLCKCDFSTVRTLLFRVCTVLLRAIKGFVTECAHVFCLVRVLSPLSPRYDHISCGPKPCLTAWIKKRREGKSCPVCR
jgi:E3 ubiquitin-protein ligase SHPRH